MLKIYEVALNTAYIKEVDSLADVLLQQDMHGKAYSKDDRNALTIVLDKIDKDHIPMIAVGVKIDGAQQADSVFDALIIAKKMQKTCIISTQIGVDGQLDAAAMVVGNGENELVWADIVRIEENNVYSNSVFHGIYQQEGPVLDLVSIICEGLAIRYGLDFDKGSNEVCYFDTHMDEDKQVSIKNGLVVLRQSKVTDYKKIEANCCVFPVSAHNAKEMELKLQDLDLSLEKYTLLEISKDLFSAYDQVMSDEKTVVFVADCKDNLKTEIQRFRLQSKHWDEEGFQWKTNRGSCYTASPVGKNAKICMINPPSGMLSKLSFYRMIRCVTELKQMIANNIISLDITDEVIRTYIFEIITELFTVKAYEYLGIVPDCVIGGSLGEMSLPLLFDIVKTDNKAFGENDVRELLEDVSSDLTRIVQIQNNLSTFYFKKRVGDMEKWYLRAELTKVKEIMQSKKKKIPLFVTIIGSPRDMVICGTPQLCEEIISTLGCYAQKLNDPLCAHTPILEPCKKKLQKIVKKKKIHIRDDINMQVYSTHERRVLDTSETMFATNFANCLVEQVNIMDVVLKAYNDGCNFFIDLSTNGICLQWAKETLKDKKEALVVSFYEQGSGIQGLLHLIVSMMTNHIKLDKEKFLNRFIFSNKIEDELQHKKDESIPCEDDHEEKDKKLQLDNEHKEQKPSVKEAKEIHKEKEIDEEVKDIKEVNDLGDAKVACETKKVSEVNDINEVKEVKNTKVIDETGLKSTSEKEEKEPISNHLNADNNILRYNALIEKQLKLNEEGYLEYLNLENMLLKKTYDLYKNNQRSSGKRIPNNCLYDYDEILEMTSGSMAKVLGKEYAALDNFKVRARMPLPPFLFVTRITKIDAKFGDFNSSCSIEGEYDVPQDCVFSINSEEISPTVLAESSHIGIFLAAYLGIDIKSNGQLRFRITDVSTIYKSENFPKIGETVQIRFEVERFIKNGDITLMICNFEVYRNNKLIILNKQIGGFFTEKELHNSAGLPEEIYKDVKALPVKMYKPICTKKTFNCDEVHAFLQGNMAACFGNTLSSFAYKVADNFMLIDRIIEIKSNGGKYGLGCIISEKDIDESFWPFACHFKNDPILPGTVMLEAMTQTSIFFQTYMGLYNRQKPVRISWKKDSMIKSQFRGEISKGKHTLRIRIDVMEVSEELDETTIAIEGAVFCEGVKIVQVNNSKSLII